MCQVKLMILNGKNRRRPRLSSHSCAGAESFSVPRETDEEQGTLSRIADTFRSYYSKAVNTASGYLEGIKSLKLEERAK